MFHAIYPIAIFCTIYGLPHPPRHRYFLHHLWLISCRLSPMWMWTNPLVARSSLQVSLISVILSTDSISSLMNLTSKYWGYHTVQCFSFTVCTKNILFWMFLTSYSHFQFLTHMYIDLLYMTSLG